MDQKRNANNQMVLKSNLLYQNLIHIIGLNE